MRGECDITALDPTDPNAGSANICLGPSNTPPNFSCAFTSQNGWLLAQDSVVECIDDFEKCLADDSGELSKHYNYNDIFFIDEKTPITLRLMWWKENRSNNNRKWSYKNDNDNDKDDDKDRPNRRNRKLTDVSMTTGVVDQFIVGDFINIGVTGPFSANGRYVHGKCRDPRKTGKAEITIETNN